MWTTFWWCFTDEYSEMAGEEFFTELKTNSFADHLRYVKELFPNEVVKCLGKVTEAEAEMMGLDTY